MPGTIAFQIAVSHVSRDGGELLAEDEELLMPFKHSPGSRPPRSNNCRPAKVPTSFGLGVFRTISADRLPSSRARAGGVGPDFASFVATMWTAVENGGAHSRARSDQDAAQNPTLPPHATLRTGSHDSYATPSPDATSALPSDDPRNPAKSQNGGHGIRTRNPLLGI